MDKEIIDLQLNNSICEAIGCFARATTNIDVKVGKKGVVSLDLCNNCIKKLYEKKNSPKRKNKASESNDGDTIHYRGQQLAWKS